MTDVEHKGVSLLGRSPMYPAIGGLAPGSPVRWSPFGALHRAQDAVLSGSRRVVANWDIGGATDWAQPNGTTDPAIPGGGGPNTYPLETVWRRLGSYRATITPGCELRARVLYCPAGLVQRGDDVSGYQNAGAWAEIRIGHSWTATPGGATTPMAYVSTMMEGSALGTWGGAENTEVGANWNDVREKNLDGMHPEGYKTDPAVAALYSEWSMVDLHIEVRGGARVLQVVIYEQPLSHVQDHDNASLKSAHAAPVGTAPMTPMPMVKAPDGGTYEEHRHGVTQTLQVAERQSERLGPVILHASSWRESDANIWDQAEANAWTTTSSSFVEIQGSGATTWSAEGRGWVVGGSMAKLHRLNDPNLIMRGGAAAVIPVRVWVDGSQSSGTGTVRVQSGPYEWVDVQVTGARGWYSAVGFLQSQVYGDHHAGNAMIFVRRTAGTLSVWNVCAVFGDWRL